MNSRTLPSYWKAYDRLTARERSRADEAFALFRENPAHPSLHFKLINRGEGLWSVRASLDLRALGLREGDTVTWFWIGRHKDYDRILGAG